MKRVIPILLMALMFTISSCEEEDLQSLCKEGTLRLTSISDYPYDFYLNGTYQATIQGRTFQEFEIEEGSYRIKVVQKSGYLLFPTIREVTISIFGCKEIEWVFPQ